MKRDRTQPRNTTKGRIRFETRDGRQVVVKDYSGIENPLVRLYGQWTLRNEAQAYNRLTGIQGIPACYGITSEGWLVLDYVPGRHLGLFKRREVPETVFERLEEILRAMHDRGVANTDLHRSNVLVSDDGHVSLIDFAHAAIARNPEHPGIIVRLAMRLDRYAYARMKARFLGLTTPKPTGLFGVLYRFVKTLKRGARTTKRSFS